MKLKNNLLPHQQKAVEKLKRLKVGALFMEQGTGKTMTVMEIARIRIEAGKIDRIIWLCPCSAKDNIRRELLRNCPDEMLGSFTICGIETLSSSIRANAYLLQMANEHRCFLVVDESLLVKNPNAYRTENITRIGDRCPYRIILNGTPISRNEADLFSQFYILDWRILGYKSYWSFAANHLEYDEYGNLRRVLNTKTLAKKISPYTFQVKKTECIKLPKKIYQTYGFHLTEAQDKEYDRVSDILMAQLDDFRPDTLYRLFSGLQAVISGKRLIFDEGGRHFESTELFVHPKENPRIKKLLDIIPEDEKAIIFCTYDSEINQLCEILDGAVKFSGSIPTRKRDAALREFAADKGYLVANKNCAGYSLNLQFCHNIIYLSNDWNLGTRLQSEDRVHRLGQTESVNIIDICARNTIDEKILECLIRKENLLDSIKKKVDNQSREMGIESIRKFVRGKEHRELLNLKELEDKDAQNIS